MSHGTVCPFCSGADPKWPDLYMVPTYFNKRLGAKVPSPRFRCLVSVTCLACGAKWTRETRRWEKIAPRHVQKQRARDQDEAALRSGEKTADDLRRENGSFCFPEAKFEMKPVAR